MKKINELTKDYVTIQNISFLGKLGGGDILAFIGTGDAVDYLTIQNCRFKNSDYKGIMVGGDYSQIINNYFDGCEQVSSIQLYGHHGIIRGNVITNGQIGIEVKQEAYNTIVQGNIIKTMSTQGIMIQADQCIISNNFIEDATSYGIWLYNSLANYNIVSNKIIKDCNPSDIYVSSDYAIITDNTCYGNGTTTKGIWLDNADYCTVSSNFTSNHDVAGIQEDSDCQNNLIYGNNCQDTTPYIINGVSHKTNYNKAPLELETGTSINEFSTDGTLSGDSDDAVPTEKAVKTYVSALGITRAENNDIDAGTEVVDSFADTLGDGVIWYYTAKQGANIRTGTIQACWDNIANTTEHRETKTSDIGDTSPLTLDVDIDSNNVRLLATASSGETDWKVKVVRIVIGEQEESFMFTVSLPSGTTELTLPLTLVGGYTHNSVVNWGDGSESTISWFNDPDRIHEYSSSGDYTVKITGTCPGFCFNNTGSKELITSIFSWGNVAFRSLDFYGCSNLVTLPSEVGKLNLLTSFLYLFYNCTSLTSIPAGLFDNNPLVTDAHYSFYNTAITSIPAGLFDDNIALNSLERCFGQCKQITSIPSGLFDNNPLVTNFLQIFYNCISLTSIPAGLFDNNPLVTTFQYGFYNGEFTSIPAGLFDNNPLVTDFKGIFRNNPITSIPAGLFDNNPLVTDFEYSFGDCSSLTGNAPELWDRGSGYAVVTSYSNCFKSDIGLANWGDIPNDWKGL